jgi:general secretion pathway protein J
MTPRPQHGFTLLELLVALSVFAVLSAMAYNGLQSVLRAREGSKAQAERLVALQTTFTWFGRDLEQAQARPVRDPYGESLKAMSAARDQDYQIEFTRSGWSNPFPSEKRRRSYLQRVAYGVREKQLIRKYWFDLDRDYESPAFETPLLEGVTALEFRFVDRNLQYQTEWPPLEGADALPQAVEVTVELDGVGKITRLYRLPEGVAPKKANPQ